MSGLDAAFTRRALDALFPPEKTDAFFDALYGDAGDGAYDIRLALIRAAENRLDFGFELHRRGNKCLACNLTHGLPQVFARHPVINVKDVAAGLAALADWPDECWQWELGATEEVSDALHLVPLTLKKVS